MHLIMARLTRLDATRHRDKCQNFQHATLNLPVIKFGLYELLHHKNETENIHTTKSHTKSRRNTLI